MESTPAGNKTMGTPPSNYMSKMLDVISREDVPEGIADGEDKHVFLPTCPAAVQNQGMKNHKEILKEGHNSDGKLLFLIKTDYEGENPLVCFKVSVYIHAF